MNINDIPLHMIIRHGRWITWTRYGNSNSFVSAIVAVITPDTENEIIDWTAYMGGSNRCQKKVDGIRHIADSTGNKISREDAEHFFPDLPIRLYRS